MKTIHQFMKEAEKIKVNIDSFLEKIYACKTVDGVNELEAYYKKRYKEVDIPDSEDIQIRDALNGRKEEIKSMENEEDNSVDL